MFNLGCFDSSSFSRSCATDSISAEGGTDIKILDEEDENTGKWNQHREVPANTIWLPFNGIGIK